MLVNTAKHFAPLFLRVCTCACACVSLRYGERNTAWVGQERWNFTLVWSSKKHAALMGCKHVMLVLHGIDTVGTVVLNGRHVLQADNAHRWVPSFAFCCQPVLH